MEEAAATLGRFNERVLAVDPWEPIKLVFDVLEISLLAAEPGMAVARIPAQSPLAARS
jgi:hypothetical protein